MRELFPLLSSSSSSSGALQIWLGPALLNTDVYKRQIQSLKNNKPPAENRVASELLKYVGDKFTQFFFELTSQI